MRDWVISTDEAALDSEYCVCGELFYEHEDGGGVCCEPGCGCQRFRPAPVER